jgi:hypothetical protein
VSSKQQKLSYADLQAENRLLRRDRNGGAIASVLNNLFKWTGVVILGYFTYQSIDSLAGKTTTADIGIKVFEDLKISDVIAAVATCSSVLYGLAQRKLRKSTIERLQGRIKKLEQSRDPSRTSSGLTPTGDTHPNDI